MSRTPRMAFGSVSFFLVLFSSLSALALDQWASSVIGFSSQYGTSSYSAQQALGVPNTAAYGDYSTSWAPASENGTLEFLTLGFDVPVFTKGVMVRETDGNGFVYQVDVLDTEDVFHTVWTGTDTSPKGIPVNFEIPWTQTDYLVKGVKIYVNTDLDKSNWEEVDAVQLHGSTASLPDLAIASVLGPGVGKVGQSIKLTFKATNLQTKDAGPFAVGVYLSTDAIIDPASDRFIGGVQFPKLLGGKSLASTLILLIPESVAPGTYYLGAAADIYSQVDELSETNNTAPAGRVIKIRR